MSNPIDLLAVMDDVANALANYSLEQVHSDPIGHALTMKTREEFREARAAIDDLIEASVAEYAAQAAFDAATSGTARTEAWNVLNPARRRRVAALSRIGAE